MKNSKLKKTIVIALLSVMVIFVAGQVMAADDYKDLTSAINGTENNTSTGNNTASNTSNTAKNNSSLNTSALTSGNNTSTYNNTSLPKTGISDSIPAIVLMVIFAISAVYAYHKIKEYRNI